MNKKGSIWPTIYVTGTVLLIGVFIWMFVMGGAIVNQMSDELIPAIRDIGEVDGAGNITEYVNYVANPVESIINQYGTFAAVIYIIGVIFIFSMAFMFRNNLSGWTIAFFVFTVLLVITTTILISNAYEEYYNGTDDLATELRSQRVASWFILYSPTIMTIICFLAGIIMFTGGDRGGYV